MNIQPLADRVVLRRLPEEQKGRIILPESAQEPSVLCEVVAVGPGAWTEGINGGVVRRPCEVRPGQKVLIGPYCDFEWDAEKLLICNEADIRGVVNEPVKRCV